MKTKMKTKRLPEKETHDMPMKITIEINKIEKNNHKTLSIYSEGTTIQMGGGVLPYKLEVYCSTFSKISRGWGS